MAVTKPELKEELKEAAGSIRVKAYCKTCRIIFLETTGEAYHRLTNVSQPDKWYLKACLHWIRNKTHLIVLELGPMVRNIAKYWKEEWYPQTLKLFEDDLELIQYIEEKLKNSENPI